MTRKAATAYAHNEIDLRVIAADRLELLHLSYEKIIDNLRLGKLSINQGGYGVEYFSKANDLIQKALLAALDYDSGGELAVNLNTLYQWALGQLIQARLERSEEKVQEVIDIFMTLQEGWYSLA
jgi:flagellar protein FliS